MSVRIANPSTQNLSAIVKQLEGVKASEELRSGPNKKTEIKELYVKTSWSNIRPNAKDLEARDLSQKTARNDIMKALNNEFPPAVANKVMTNMNSFFTGIGEVTVADARAVLKQANDEASFSAAVVPRRGLQMTAAAALDAGDARGAELRNANNLFDTQNHPQAAGAFRTFLSKEQSVENFDFVQTVRGYKAIPPDASTAHKQVAANAVVKQFIGAMAVTEVNLPSNLMNPLTNALERFGELTPAQQNEIFDAAEENIIHLSKSDSARRFLNSPEARNYINNG